MAPVDPLAVNRSPRRPPRHPMARRLVLAASFLVAAWGSGTPSGDAQERLHQGRPLAEWTADLSNPDGLIRRRAAGAIVAFGADALPPLGKAAVSDADSEVRLEAIKGLARLGPVAGPAVPTLVQATRDRVAFVRRGAVSALGTVAMATPEVLEALIHALVDVDAAVIDNAAHSLLALGAPSIGPLTNSLKDTDVGLRQMAVLTLSGGIRFGKLRPIPDETVTALIETLGDTSSDIRDEAARALADLGPQAKGALPALRRMAASDPADAVRLVARRAIEQIESRP
jgi:HEAT repeat protein